MRRNGKGLTQGEPLFLLLPFACRPCLLPRRDNEICSTPLALLTAFTLRFAWDESRRERHNGQLRFVVAMERGRKMRPLFHWRLFACCPIAGEYMKSNTGTRKS